MNLLNKLMYSLLETVISFLIIALMFTFVLNKAGISNKSAMRFIKNPIQYTMNKIDREFDNLLNSIYIY